jgi:hypothetical protein
VQKSKPDGKEIIVNTDEEVLTKDENKSKSKLIFLTCRLAMFWIITCAPKSRKTTEMQGPYIF